MKAETSSKTPSQSEIAMATGTTAERKAWRAWKANNRARHTFIDQAAKAGLDPVDVLNDLDPIRCRPWVDGNVTELFTKDTYADLRVAATAHVAERVPPRPAVPTKCGGCEITFAGDGIVRYHSLQCRTEAKRIRRLHFTNVCRWCTRSFATRDEDQEGCSGSCSARLRHSRLAHERVCVPCGTVFHGIEIAMFHDKSCRETAQQNRRTLVALAKKKGRTEDDVIDWLMLDAPKRGPWRVVHLFSEPGNKDRLKRLRRWLVGQAPEVDGALVPDSTGEKNLDDGH